MLPAKYRLQLRRTLPFYLFDRKVHTSGFSLYWRKIISSDSQVLPPAQTAIVVPKKVARTAVLRNRTKRVLSSALFEHMASLPQGIQFVVVVRHPNLLEQPEELLKTIKEKLH